MKDQPRIFVYPNRCLGCHSCEIACALAHAKSTSLFTAIYEEPKPQKRIFVEGREDATSPIHCRHCEGAPCVNVCPSGALFSDSATALIQYHEQKCIGCFMCGMACPFGVIRWNPENQTVVKCDYCLDRETPACVAACPSRALQFQSEAEYERARRQEISRYWWDIQR